MVNHLPESWVVDEIIAETDSETVRYVKLSTKSPLELENWLCLKTLLCPHFYDEYVLKEILVEGLL